MTIEAKKQYLKAIQLRYRNSDKSQKSRILDEFCLTCNYSRKYAIQILNRNVSPSSRAKGKKSIYDRPDVLKHLTILWEAMGKICSKKMVAAIPLWLEHYGLLEAELKTLLLSISSASVDRLFKKHRIRTRTFSATNASLFKSKIPLELLDRKIKGPGFVEADTVVHCGNSLAGEYAISTTVTDVFSGWTENRATWTKSSEQIVKIVEEIELCLPFNLEGFATDNGSEFLNNRLKDYFLNNAKRKVKFVRRRPYQKNDNAHVEQKNWTHVRQLFGYHRVDNYLAIELMNEIYRHYWNPLQNFFLPTMKLKRKTRIGGRVKKEYEDLKTPYQRILEAENVSEEQKRALKTIKAGLNPFKLREILEVKLKQFRQLTERTKDVA